MKAAGSSNRRRGMTLIEVMTALAIFSIVLISLMTVFKQGSRAFQESEAHIEKYIAARGVLEMMAREIKGAIVKHGIEAGLLPDIDLNFFVYQGITNNRDTDRVYFIAPIESSGKQQLCGLAYRIDNNGTSDPTDDVLRRYLHTDGPTSTWPAVGKSNFFNSIWNGGTFNELGLNVRELNIRCWDDSIDTWADLNWDSTSVSQMEKLPPAVKIEVTVGDSKDVLNEKNFSTVVILENAR